MHIAQEQVAYFMSCFGQAVAKQPRRLNVSESMVRKAIVIEELEEAVKAFTARDPLDLVDAMVDILYTVYGTAASMGVDLEEFFDEVHHNNMTKGWTHDELGFAPDGSVSHPMSSMNGRFVVKVNGKVIKPPSWTPPDLKSIWDAQYYRAANTHHAPKN